MKNVSNNDTMTRRTLMTRLASGLFVAGFTGLSGAAFAEELARTAGATEGPFYPYRALPLDRDNDLIIVNNAVTPAVGTIAHLTGRVTDAKGTPLRNALVEIWQCDAKAVYLAERDRNAGRFDGNFQGYGRFETDSTGTYRFRTIQPVAYPGRPAPHIHYKITVKGKNPFTTQLFIAGHPGNARDGVYGELGDPAAKATVTKDFLAVKDSRIGERAARFDITLG